MSYWPEDDRRPRKEPGPFDEVFRDAKEGGLTWPVRDRYGLVEIKGPTKILPDGWAELVRQSPKGADLALKQAERLMAQQGINVTASPWLFVGDDPDDVLPTVTLPVEAPPLSPAG